ncbi:unnamed protein product (macronuclear) [Paramecium tetraurelia]|uniref:Uncharacterized protein n=1 Tax=Paramecium tetraurelia TaxID=5888 RepID=A0E3D7_PARTE|nr:uncharacterized protein GSPATT00022977001 [Paramecium tetraurelia]CAK89804.1 unnamed protein product [Paramecium tetraurelia]|eukprot:XP_001457201.1 hypothetical protein (macronuclear) [Paramecium tetraurelia strain d4-2]
MSEVNSEEEIDEQHPTKITDTSPIKKGDFMTYSQLQKKINSVIPDEETVSYNTSAVQNSQLTYSMSQFEKSNLVKIEEVNESQHSLFSQLQQSHFVSDNKESQKKDQEIEILKQQNAKQQKEIEELQGTIQRLQVHQKGEIDQLSCQLDEKDKIITRLTQFEAYTQEQQKMINQKEKQLKDLKEQYEIRTYNLQQIVDDQTESIKTLHKQISLSNNNSQIVHSPNLVEKIRLKQQNLKSQFEELSKLYDEVICETPQTPTSSKKQILTRTPSKSIHLIQSPQQSNSEQKPTLI